MESTEGTSVRTTVAAQAPQDILDTIVPLLKRSPNDDRPVILMTCGLAGSGKTTLVKAVIGVLPQFTRLSIDEIIFEEHGLYGVDYPADDKLYEQYNEEADAIYLDTFRRLLEEKKDVVLERSFYAKEDRDEFKKMVEDGGGRLVLVYLKAVDKEVLWDRICSRSAKGKEANSSLDISREILDRYWAGFEAPDGEGEVVVDVLPALH
ncbi:hypothetical protein PMZ80_009711 [Knufia obscura]|uniref:P-loop containing nucleoside triphosphate hydrolase protein n=2 Tax=Knufia TaxID=430999 RepID=A0AAN8E9I5_9EURO|nr:hypothetical protein PMZ80_009711 [Knufia obscura]KAK5949719.1 hypothetical protein OHC33_009316 [Knufia fluminis]